MDMNETDPQHKEMAAGLKESGLLISTQNIISMLDRLVRTGASATDQTAEQRLLEII